MQQITMLSLTRVFFCLPYSCGELSLESTDLKKNYSPVNHGGLRTLQHLSKCTHAITSFGDNQIYE
jgi:hypothetical protein